MELLYILLQYPPPPSPQNGIMITCQYITFRFVMDHVWMFKVIAHLTTRILTLTLPPMNIIGLYKDLAQTWLYNTANENVLGSHCNQGCFSLDLGGIKWATTLYIVIDPKINRGSNGHVANIHTSSRWKCGSKELSFQT